MIIRVLTVDSRSLQTRSISKRPGWLWRMSALPLAALVAIASSSCGDPDASNDNSDSTPAPTSATSVSPTTPLAPTPSEVDASALDGRTFLSTSAVGVTLVDASSVRLSFSGDQISVSPGCNSAGGTFALDGAVLQVGSMFMTEMACEQPLMDQDQAVLDLLGASPIITLDDAELVITAGDRSITFLDREVADPDRPLVGTVWTLTSIITADAVTTTPDGSTSTLTITGTSAAVEPGCNRGSAEVIIGDGEGEGTIEFGPMRLTKMACEPELMELESTVSGVLSGSVAYQIEAGSLTITGPDGRGLQYSALD